MKLIKPMIEKYKIKMTNKLKKFESMNRANFEIVMITRGVRIEQK